MFNRRIIQNRIKVLHWCYKNKTHTPFDPLPFLIKSYNNLNYPDLLAISNKDTEKRFFHSHLTIWLQLIKHTSPGSQLTPANDATSLIKFHTKGEIYTSKITHTIGQGMNLPVPDFRHPQDRNTSICTSHIFHIKIHYLKFKVHFYYKYYHSQCSNFVVCLSSTQIVHSWFCCQNKFSLLQRCPMSFTQPRNGLEFSSNIGSRVFAAWRRVLVLSLWLPLS